MKAEAKEEGVPFYILREDKYCTFPPKPNLDPIIVIEDDDKNNLFHSDEEEDEDEIKLTTYTKTNPKQTPDRHCHGI